MKHEIYNIIEILDNTRLLIDAGENQGISKGNVFEIFVTGEPVINHETGNTLGTLDFIKDEIEVVTAYKNFSLCRKIIRTKSSIFSSLDNLTTTNIHIGELNVNKDQITNRKISGDPIISVGDTVRLKP